MEEFVADRLYSPMLYLQLIIQMQTQLAEKAGSSNILNKPEHILSFIKHALTTPIVHYNSASEQVRHLTTDALKLEDLRIVPPEDDLSEEGDSDDEGSEAPGVSADAEITETAVNLLLAILEGKVLLFSAHEMLMIYFL